MRELSVYYCDKCGYYAYYQLPKNAVCHKCKQSMILLSISHQEFTNLDYEARDRFIVTKMIAASPTLANRITAPEKLYHQRKLVGTLTQQIKEQEKEIRENNEVMLEALSSLVEFRNIETGEHTQRIKYFTKIMLEYLQEYFPKYGLDKYQIDQIVRACVLHDIGKIGIPDSILLKPGRLTNEEFEMMKSHTIIGCDILEKSYRKKDSDFYRYSYDICRHHHERWDGKGYPDHLKGDEISIGVQVVSVADVYDALVSPRIYKEPFSKDKAYDMIINGECGQFSPDVLECFVLAKEDVFNCQVIKMLKFV